MINCQPSTSTNSISLNGSEMVAGDTIIIPIPISTLATTRSMMRKGMKAGVYILFLPIAGISQSGANSRGPEKSMFRRRLTTPTELNNILDEF